VAGRALRVAPRARNVGKQRLCSVKQCMRRDGLTCGGREQLFNITSQKQYQPRGMMGAVMLLKLLLNSGIPG
jgi:hypothetical protein